MKKIENKKENNNKEKVTRKENFIEIFIRNYKNVEGVRIVTKLAGYFLFIIVLLIMMSIASLSAKNYNNNEIKPTPTVSTTDQTVNYKIILNNLINTKKIYLYVTSENDTFQFNYDINMDGYYENGDSTKHLKVVDGVVYEIKLQEQIESNILSNINIDYLNINYLIDLFSNNIGTIEKTDEYTKRIYRINDISYIVEHNSTQVTSIEFEINGYKYSYSFDY